MINNSKKRKSLLKLRNFFLFISISAFIQPGLYGATIFWNGSFNSNWNAAVNWDGGVVPGANDVAVINSGATFYPEVETTISLQRLRINSNAKFTLFSDGQLNIDGSEFTGIRIDGEFISFGKIYINNVSGDGIGVTGTGECRLYGDTFIGNSGSIGDQGLANSGLVIMDGFGTSDNTPTLQIDRTASDAIYNFNGTIEINESFDGITSIQTTINIGTTVGNSVESGIFNLGEFKLNGGTINIPSTGGSAIIVGAPAESGTFFTSSSSSIIIGGSSNNSINGDGIIVTNNSIFINNSQLAINGTAANGISVVDASEFLNNGLVVIGNTGDIQLSGILSEATFSNREGGEIRVIRAEEFLIFNRRGFNNFGRLKLGSVPTFDKIAVLSLDQFINFPSGNIEVQYADAAFAIFCTSGSCTIINEGRIEVGKNGNIIREAVFIDDEMGIELFENRGCSATFEIYSGNITAVPNLSFINSGTILYASSALIGSSIDINSGLIFKISNTAPFTVGSGNPPLEVDPSFEEDNFWTGCNSRVWTDAENWSKGHPPTLQENATILGVGTSATLVQGQSAFAADFYLEDNSLLFAGNIEALGDFNLKPTGVIIGNFGNIVVGGEFNIDGIFNNLFSTSLTLNGFQNQTLGQEITQLVNLTIDKPSGIAAIGNSNLEILTLLEVKRGELRINSGQNLTTQFLNLTSDQAILRNRGTVKVD